MSEGWEERAKNNLSKESFAIFCEEVQKRGRDVFSPGLAKLSESEFNFLPRSLRNHKPDKEASLLALAKKFYQSRYADHLSIMLNCFTGPNRPVQDIIPIDKVRNKIVKILLSDGRLLRNWYQFAVGVLNLRLHIAKDLENENYMNPDTYRLFSKTLEYWISSNGNPTVGDLIERLQAHQFMFVASICSKKIICFTY